MFASLVIAISGVEDATAAIQDTRDNLMYIKIALVTI